MFCYIILHYQVEEETINCVKQLNRVKGNHRIIIVDNCSPNGSGIHLKEKYQNNPAIDVILHTKNDGYARGNNLGCKFAKEHYDPAFYVVMNNDIEINQEDFETIVTEIYERERFDVLGPDIYSTTYKVHQSPKSLKRTTIEGAQKLKKTYEKRMKSRVIVPVRCYLKKIAILKKFRDSMHQNATGVDSQKKYYNIPLHGSCIIFSKNYMQSRKEAFFPKTFFYYEMEILDFECKKNNLKEVYDPAIRVLHHQNASTNATYTNEIKRVRFMNEQNYASINAFLEEYQ